MNNAVFCAVRPSKISYINNRTVFTSVKEQISFVIKPGILFSMSLIIFCRVYLLSSSVRDPNIFMFLHIKHEMAVEFHFDIAVENACGLKQIFSFLMDQ